MSEKQERIALVIGGSRGIGRASAERLAADGMKVMIAYGHNTKEAEATVAAIEAAGGTAKAVKADVADETQMAEAFAQTERAFGGIDVLVHAAGILRLSPIAELSMDDLDELLRVNVRGAFIASKLATKHVRAGGAIIHFSSTVTKASMPNYGAYTATKAAVNSINLILARELRNRDITVNAVAPGATVTELFLKGKDQATLDAISRLSPMERLGEVDDIAQVVSFLAGPARWVNGQVIYTNGGAI